MSIGDVAVESFSCFDFTLKWFLCLYFVATKLVLLQEKNDTSIKEKLTIFI